MTQEMEEDRIEGEQDNEEENSHDSIIINDFEKINVTANTSQMEQ